MDGPIKFTEEMLMVGAQVLRRSGMFPPETPSQHLIVLANNVYKAMERVRPVLIKDKEVPIIGGTNG